MEKESKNRSDYFLLIMVTTIFIILLLYNNISQFLTTIMNGLISNSSTISDFLTAGSAVCVAIVAIYGLNTWKKQLKGKIEFEIAEKMLSETYNIRDRVKNFRAMFMSSNEKYFAIKGTDLENIEARLFMTSNRVTLAAYNVRWNILREAFLEIQSISFRAEAILGKDVNIIVEKLGSNLSELYYSYNDLFGSDDHQNDPEKKDHDKEMREILFATSNKDDKFQTKFDQIVKDMENFLKPFLMING